MAEVILEKVSKIYPNGIEAVKEIDWEIKDHEFMVLISPSGCGNWHCSAVIMKPQPEN